MEKTEVSRNQLVNELLRIGHGDLSIFGEVGLKAVKVESELFGHLIAWNHKKGEVRDSKVAFPVLALRGASDKELYENAVAHLCKLDPRNLIKADSFSRGLTSGKIRVVQKTPVTFGDKEVRKFPSGKTRYAIKEAEISVPPSPAGPGAMKIFKDGIGLYIRNLEKSRKRWHKVALQHRKNLKSIYALSHIKPAAFAQNILFGEPTGKMIKGKDGRLKPEVGPRVYPKGSVFEAVKQLKDMDPKEAAGTILNHEIPFLIAVGALGGIKGKDDIILALIERMSGSELVTNTDMLKRYGVFDNPVLSAAYDGAVKRTAKDKRVSTLKASKAAETVKDKKAGKKLEQIQEQRLQQLGGIEGDWLVLGDRSGSMARSIEVARNVASLIAQQVKGTVHLVFFNTAPTFYDVTGKSLGEITGMTARVQANGGTSIGCGLQLLHEKGILVNGIAICSDGGDNTMPLFHDVYRKYAEKTGIDPTVYLFHVPGDPDELSDNCLRARIMLEKFKLGLHVDYYSLPNIIKTLRTSKYSLIEEIMEMPLLKFGDVFK